MGREVKRVPLDFDWPVGKVWAGFLNPHYEKCPTCDGSGTTTAYARVTDLIWFIMISADDTRRGKCHPRLQESPLYNTRGLVVSKDILQLTTALAGREPSFMGHDSCDKWNAVKKFLKAADMPESWGNCPHCGGDGIKPEIREVYESWKETPVPSGEGYQIWSTTTEGNPMTPVFVTPEELARHCTDNRVSTFGNDTANYATWLKFIKGPGWAPSMAGNSSGLESGVAASVR